MKAAATALAEFNKEILRLAGALSEYPSVQGVFGFGPALWLQLLAKIGDVRRFYSKKTIVALASLVAPQMIPARL